MTTVSARKSPEGAGFFGGPLRRLVPLDEDAARLELADIAEIAKDRGLPRLVKLASGKSASANFLGALFNLSPFMRDCVRRQPAILDRLFDISLEARLAEIHRAIEESAAAEGVSEAS